MMNIVVSVNEEYLDKAESMLFSLREQVDGCIVVYFLNHSIHPGKMKRFKEYLKIKCHMDMVNIKVDASIFDSMPLGNNRLFSIEMYYRILIPWLLPETAKRALWLDADLIVCGDISELYHKNFEGHSIVACVDHHELSEKARNVDCERLMLDPGHKYFNSGVLLMNTERMRQRYTIQDIYRMAERIKDKLIYPDQDLLNCLYQNDVLYEDYKKYNANPKMVHYMSDEEYQQLRILHYYGTRKPWNIIKGFDPRMNYWNVQKRRGRFVVFQYIIFSIKNKLANLPWLVEMYYRMLKKLSR